MRIHSVEVAIVGGGPAGACTALLLAGLGHDVLLLERAPRWRWRACGVFAGPAAVQALRRMGLSDEDLRPLAQPVSAMRVESRRGAVFRLSYDGTGVLEDSAVGFDRERLDETLLERAADAGAQVRRGVRVEAVLLDGGRPRLRVLTGADSEPADGAIEARVLVGADGLRSIVAGAVGAAARAPFGNRTALTFHVPAQDVSVQPDAAVVPDARMVVVRDGYVGVAPVPGGRTNVGIVLGSSWSAQLARDGAATVAMHVLALALTGGRSDPQYEAMPRVLDAVAGTRPVSTAARRCAGDAWLLVGDAAGFLDPFTGEGIHRALVSAELAATTIDRVLRQRPGAGLIEHDRAMRSRFRTKDVVSCLVQAFLAHPALFEYAARRLAARQAIRDTMGRVIGDLEPASHALDPRFLAGLLAP